MIITINYQKILQGMNEIWNIKEAMSKKENRVVTGNNELVFIKESIEKRKRTGFLSKWLGQNLKQAGKMWFS